MFLFRKKHTFFKSTNNWILRMDNSVLLARKFGREKCGKFTSFEYLVNKVWQISRSAKRLII